MANEIQEFFLGRNEQEIEDERRKRNFLIKMFPHSMGDTDQTKYILRSDSNTNQNESFGNNAIDKPGTTAVSQPKSPLEHVQDDEGEKPKEQNREQMPKAPDFGNGNFKSPFETNGFMQTGSLNGLNNTGRDNVSYAPGKQKRVYETTPGTAGNDAFRLDSINTSDNPDLLWSDRRQKRTYYSNNSLSINNNITQKRKQEIRGNIPTKDYSEEINILKSQLPQRALDILKELGTEVVLYDNLHYIDQDGNIQQPLGIYHSNKITLDSKHVNIETLLAETIHAVQDYLGMADNGISNLEFQEHVLKDLYYLSLFTKTNNYENYNNLSTSTDTEYINLIFNSIDKNGVLNLKYFLNGINSHFKRFQNNYKRSDAYQTPVINNFNYGWIRLFQILGIEYK